MSVEIATLSAEVDIDLPPLPGRRKARRQGSIRMEIYTGGCRVWDGVDMTDCGEVYIYDRSKPYWDIVSPKPLTGMPYFDEVFRHLTEQHAANRNNLVGKFLQETIAAM